MNFISRVTLALLLLIPVYSKSLAQEFIPPMPSDLNQTRISLLTVGLGSDLYARYGHTMLRVLDKSNKLDYLANWGMFDFSDPFFIPKFFRGILIYRMSFSPYDATLRYYRDREKRSVTEDELVLTNNQKHQLMEKIIWNAQPENLNYPYQYFRNNCATIPRDYLDVLTKGSIKRNFEKEIVPLTYRDYVRTNLSVSPFVGWGLDVIMNGDTDHQLSKWEEMFYPLKLREYLSTLNRVDDSGAEIPGQPLLANHRVLVDLPEPDGRAIDGYHLTWLVAGFPLMAILISMVFRRRKGALISCPWHYRLFGFVSIWWGLTSGFFGLTHFSGWVLSSHTDLHRNLNILLFWPLDMLVLIPGLQLGLFGRTLDLPGFLKLGFWRKLAIFHIAFVPIYVIFAYSGLFVQSVRLVVVYMAPLSLLYYGVMAQLAAESQLDRNRAE